MCLRKNRKKRNQGQRSSVWSNKCFSKVLVYNFETVSVELKYAFLFIALIF